MHTGFLLLAPLALASLRPDPAAAPAAAEAGEGAHTSAEEQAALQIVAAHLAYLDKCEEMVKRSEAMMDEVLHDRDMALSDKVEALDMLASHLSMLQESAKKTLAGMGLDTSDLDEEEDPEEMETEEDELEEKLQHHGRALTAGQAPPGSSFLRTVETDK